MASRFLFRRRVSLFYTSILIVTVVVSNVFVFFSIDNRELNVRKEALSGQVRQLRMTVDSLFGKVRSDLAFLADRKEFQDLKTWYSATDYRQKKIFFTAIAPMTVLLDNYDEVVIFSPQDQMFLDMKNKLAAPVVGSRLEIKLKVLATYLSAHPNERQSLASLEIDGGPATYFLKWIESSPGKPVLLIVQLNDSFFGTILNSLLLGDDTYVVILNQTGGLIQARYKGAVTASEEYQELVPGGGATALSADGKYLLGTDISPDSGWTFRFGIDVTTIQAQVLGVLFGYSLLPLLVLGIALLVLSRLSRKLYQPVAELFEALKPFGGAEMTDEFAQIQQNLAGLLSQNTELKETVRKNRSRSGREALRALVVQRGVTGEEILATFQAYAWDFPVGDEARFQISLFLFREPEEGPQVDPEFRFPELPGRHYEFFAIDERVTCCLVGFQCGTSFEVPVFAGPQLPLVQAQGVSEVHQLWDELPEAFREAKTALEYRTLSSGSPLILFSEVQKNRKILYFYPYEAEKRIVTGLKKLDAVVADEGFTQFEEEVREAGVAFSNQIHLHFHLLDTLVCLLRDFDIVLGASDQLLMEDLWTKVAEADKTEGLVQGATGVIELVLRVLSQSKESSSAAVIANEARALIEARFGDRNLSLDLIAGTLGYSVSHVSTIFRVFFGETIKNTITGLRLSRAKELLGQTDEKIIRISEFVGYDNVGSFEKIFKAYIGESPKEYRLRTQKK